MTTDKSEDFKDTFGVLVVWMKLIVEFLDRRLGDVHSLGRLTGDVSEYVSFTAHAIKNIANSRGMWFWYPDPVYSQKKKKLIQRDLITHLIDADAMGTYLHG